MSPVELSVNFFEAIEKKNWFEVSSLLHEDFELHTGLPEPIDKKTFLDWQEALVEACPDWSFGLSESKQSDHSAIVKIGISATHTKTLRLPIKGIKPLPPTHQGLTIAQEEMKIQFKGDLIHRIYAHSSLHGGVLGVLEQLGYEL